MPRHAKASAVKPSSLIAMALRSVPCSFRAEGTPEGLDFGKNLGIDGLGDRGYLRHQGLAIRPVERGAAATGVGVEFRRNRSALRHFRPASHVPGVDGTVADHRRRRLKLAYP